VTHDEIAAALGASVTIPLSSAPVVSGPELLALQAWFDERHRMLQEDQDVTEAVLIEFEYDGRPFTIGRAAPHPVMHAGQAMQTWVLRGDGCLLGRWQCSDAGLPAVLRERARTFAELDRWAGLLKVAADEVSSYLASSAP
jgi:hypothetical protein